MATAFKITQAQQLSQQMSSIIYTFWQTGQFEQFFGVDDVKIATAKFIHPSAKQCIVVSPGRAEGYLKYQEMAFDLYNNGYSVFIIDHRGQGLSGRMLADPHKGYIERFDHYAIDLKTFIDDDVSKYCEQAPLLLAHSMGSAIAIRLMQHHPKLIKAAVLSSPMIAINSGGIPKWLAKSVISMGNRSGALLGKESWYFIGHGPYQPHQFEDNDLSHSVVRYSIFAELYKNTPKLQLGGVTFQWLAQAMQAHRDIVADINKITTPLLILQASNDTIVSNKAQFEFCQQLKALNPEICSSDSPVVIEGAKHELFFEQDSYRTDALTRALDWFTKF